MKKFKLCPTNKNKDKDKEKNIEEDEEEEEEYDGDETGEIFLSQLEEEQDNLIIKFLNKTNNLCLDEILLSLFDGKFTLFFENKKKADLILNQSFDIFKKCVNYIENKKYKISDNNKLGFLYCISYIKYYSYYFAKIVFNEEFQNINKNEIYAFLNTPSNFRKVIKIYILKILNLIINILYAKWKIIRKQKKY